MVALTAWLMAALPLPPPKISNTLARLGMEKLSLAFCGEALKRARRIGAPLYLPFAILSAVSKKEVKTYSHFFALIRLASPGDKSLSCAKQGIFSFLALFCDDEGLLASSLHNL